MEIERLGPYQIVGKLGRGGMGTVYEGVHCETGEPAAIKLLSPELAQEEGFRNRFEAEIETLRKLNHPNIVRLIGFGQHDGHMFYSMELVDGNSLEEELRRGGRFDWREVTQMGIETCRALRHAHDRGIIHRDIKPGNILLAKDGHVKLSDFGIARLFGYSRLTNAGNVVGTAEYMPPEQAAGLPVDVRSDLYSVGALLYALLARRPVFRGKSLVEVLHKQRYELPEPVRKYATDVPEELERILAQLLEKDPAKRIPNADVLGRRLDAMLRSLQVGAETLAANTDWFATGDSTPSSELPTLIPLPDDSPIAPTIDRPGNGQPPTVLPVETIAQAVSPPSAAPVMITTSENEATTTATLATSNHFIPVGEHELDPLARDTTRPAMVSWQTWALAASLLLVGMTVWWFLQPPSADTLFHRIQARMDDESSASQPSTRSEIDDVRKVINEFLSRYSNDANGVVVRRWDKELEQRRQQFDFEQHINGRNTRLSPVEQMYLEAIGQMRLNPTRAVTALQALVDLYGQSGEQDKKTKQCLSAARLRLAQLRREVDNLAKDQMAVLEKRLDAADAKRSQEPEVASKIYHAVVELYGDKPWAAEAVARARKSLEKRE